jgi:hypothetical protein
MISRVCVDILFCFTLIYLESVKSEKKTPAGAVSVFPGKGVHVFVKVCMCSYGKCS